MIILRLIFCLLIMMSAVSCENKDQAAVSAFDPPPSPDMADLSTCEEFLQAFNAELSHIGYCTDAAQCGLVLKRTSCGCTRDRVARSDADAAKFYDIIARAKAKGCNSLPLNSICDCPAADGFACVDQRCSWNYQ